ncbi:MAG: MFS transporter [Proteobacteria bacterium]|nr:MFS transporter [Pseudomonadota bacterium]
MKKSVFSLVGVAALGYFVDIFDLALFGIVRVQSLKDLGVAEERVLSVGVQLLNAQMLGLLFGGLIWGVLGDKYGRLKVLFGSILLYSVANLANAWVNSPETYAYLRFVAGLGLAGELGAAITLVAETLPKEKRGYGTAIVAGVGLSGAVAAGILSEWVSWRMTYAIGGGLGLLLLILRFKVSESSLFTQIKTSHDISRGNLLLLFRSPKRLMRYLCCICIAVPIWYCAGILMTFAPEIGSALQARETLSAGRAILFSYVGVSIGDVLSGVLSQLFKSRKKIIGWALALEGVVAVFILTRTDLSSSLFYGLAFIIGLATGYWAIFVTVTSENFGTNLRSTVTTSAPNFVRASVVPMTLALTWLKPQLGLLPSVAIIGIFVFLLASVSLFFLDETFSKDLNYLET